MYFSWNQPPLRLVLKWNILLLCFVLPAGCGNSKRAAVPLRLPPPILPAAETTSGANHVEECVNNTNEKEADKPVTEIVLAYVGSGRDFRHPSGSDGYVLRVIPLDGSHHEVKLAADVFINLYSSVDAGNLQGSVPLRIWQLSAETLADYWINTSLLDGFMFRLDWGQEALPPGDYIFLVLMKYQHKGLMKSVCQKIAFRSI